MPTALRGHGFRNGCSIGSTDQLLCSTTCPRKAVGMAPDANLFGIPLSVFSSFPRGITRLTALMKMAGQLMLTLDQTISLHYEFREHVADTVRGIHEKELNPLFTTVLLKSFTFCFNTYKAIGLLLPDHYYEQGPLLRIMWEASLNLAWVENQSRGRAFLHQWSKHIGLSVASLSVKRGKSTSCSSNRFALQQFESLKTVLDEYRP